MFEEQRLRHKMKALFAPVLLALTLQPAPRPDQSVLIEIPATSPWTDTGIVLNAGGYTHSSIAIRDAVAAVDVPVIEVHISNIFARDQFRHHSHIAPVAKASLCGFGVEGYALAIAGLAAMLGKPKG